LLRPIAEIFSTPWLYGILRSWSGSPGNQTDLDHHPVWFTVNNQIVQRLPAAGFSSSAFGSRIGSCDRPQCGHLRHSGARQLVWDDEGWITEL